ncbi:MAG: hypothetical protein JF614_31395 [Acidobacteria bacterium]|nr:hypothetical protein [Acidobacteriota bacterium]
MSHAGYTLHWTGMDGAREARGVACRGQFVADLLAGEARSSGAHRRSLGQAWFAGLF